MAGVIYLIPNTLGECDVNHVLPSYNKEVILGLTHYIVEDVRTARRFLKKVDPSINIDALTFYTLNNHTPQEEIASYILPAKSGIDMGIISEAGCPAIADPGADIARLAQENDVRVVPLVGPSSILLALMASGFNGQSFAFVGYLPIKPNERDQRIRQLEKRASVERQSQIFIETPYRNDKLFENILSVCRPSTKVCVACDITLETEYIKTKSVAQWKSAKRPDLDKRPCIFILY